MDYKENREIHNFVVGLEELNIKLNDTQMQQFLKYYEIMISMNKVMNLTAITEFSEVINKHFLDSLSLVKLLYPTNERIIDIGTGAGLPGIPLKIAFPDTQIILMDSLNKRIGFLNELIEELKLRDIQAIHGRAEDYGGHADFREAFDISTSRAVARLSTLSEYCLPFVRVGGSFISYKAASISEELKEAGRAIELLGGRVKESKEFELPYTDIRRSLIMIEKKKRTPNKYPRAAGKPSKEPL